MKEIPAELVLNLSYNTAEMPGKDGNPDIAPYCLVIDTSGYFSVVSYLYTDTGREGPDMRYFTDGDMPRPETDFVAWALLPDLT